MCVAGGVFKRTVVRNKKHKVRNRCFRPSYFRLEASDKGSSRVANGTTAPSAANGGWMTGEKWVSSGPGDGFKDVFDTQMLGKWSNFWLKVHAWKSMICWQQNVTLTLLPYHLQHLHFPHGYEVYQLCMSVNLGEKQACVFAFVWKKQVKLKARKCSMIQFCNMCISRVLFQSLKHMRWVIYWPACCLCPCLLKAILFDCTLGWTDMCLLVLCQCPGVMTNNLQGQICQIVLVVLFGNVSP